MLLQYHIALFMHAVVKIQKREREREREREKEREREICIFITYIKGPRMVYMEDCLQIRLE